MEYGIFTSAMLEVAQTKAWALCLYCNSDKSVMGAKLYNGIDYNKTLAAVVERNNKENTTLYAYEIPDGSVYANDASIKLLIGEKYSYGVAEMNRIDTIEIVKPYEMQSVSDKGIAYCLRQWRMGTFYHVIPDGMQFQMVTNKVEYIFRIQNGSCNIYCGATVIVPDEQGTLGIGQYFRLRNNQDNAKPSCEFTCNLGSEMMPAESPHHVCESGKCMLTKQGIYYPVKRYDDNEIVLYGCGGAEYCYSRKRKKSEYFKVE